MTRAGEFRPDIGALRAIAVTAVLFFHFGVPPFGGGFAGVDVFYVISGFLMTQIIERRIVAGRFSLVDFYWARARRIVPALAVLCLALLMFGAVFIDPLTYEKQAGNALSSLTFLSNFHYLREKGYFTGDARENWLLHTWSLSVEWQFYIVYPIVLMIIARWKALYRHIGLVLGAIALASFALSVSLSGQSTDTAKQAFFLLPPRAWEMIAGGLVALYGPKLRLAPAARGAMQAAGMLLIGASAVLFDGDLPWPSYWAAVPVIGTALVILAWRAEARWATLPGVQALGAWSYSIYLWHWPIVVGLTYFHAPKGPLTVAGGIAAAVTAGWLSYELVETRLRDRLFAPQRWGPRLAGVGALVLAGLALGVAVQRTDGFESERATSAARPLLADYRAALDDWTSEKVCANRKVFDGGLRLCRFGDPMARDVLVIGDSHAQQMEPRYAALVPQAKGRSLTFAIRTGCPPLPGVERSAPGWDCAALTKKAFQLAETGAYRRVVIIGSWQSYLDLDMTGRLDPRVCFPEATCRAFMGRAGVGPAADAAFQRLADEMTRLRAKGIEVVLIGPFPYAPQTEPREAYRRVFEGGSPPVSYSRAEFERYTAFSDARLRQAAERSGATYVDPVAAICGPDVCPAVNDGRFLYKERSHYRASQVTAPLFAFLDPYLLAQPAL